MSELVSWADAGWSGWIDPAARAEVGAWLVAAASGTGRSSRHARTLRVAGNHGAVWVKSYRAPGRGRAWRAFRMTRALATAGFGVASIALAAARDREGLVVTREVEGEELATAVARHAGTLAAKRTLLRALGAEVARLHRAGFVHGDLVPPNVRVTARGFVLLDNDRTRRSRLLVALTGRRNLVQLGRFVVAGVTLTDRARVLAAYAAARGMSRRARRRLARWVMQKTTARRCAIDHIPPATAERAGFRELMRSGGPFDPAGRAVGMP